MTFSVWDIGVLTLSVASILALPFWLLQFLCAFAFVSLVLFSPVLGFGWLATRRQRGRSGGAEQLAFVLLHKICAHSAFFVLVGGLVMFTKHIASIAG